MMPACSCRIFCNSSLRRVASCTRSAARPLIGFDHLLLLAHVLGGLLQGFFLAVEAQFASANLFASFRQFVFVLLLLLERLFLGLQFGRALMTLAASAWAFSNSD